MSNLKQSVCNASDLVLRGDALTLSQVHDVANRRQRLKLTDDMDVLQRMRSAEAVVQRAVDEGWRVYGVTTGFGSMAEVTVPGEHAAASQNNLLAFLATGAGRSIDPRHVRAAMLLRANMLLRGMSGVRVEIVDRLLQFLSVDAVPVVRELGSIGASGDLVPLAAIARAITGQSGSTNVCWNGREVDSRSVLSQLGLEPIELRPKEGLAIVNGTSFSAGIAANCVSDVRSLLSLSIGVHAMMIRALCGHDEPFDSFVHQSKGHRGQSWAAYAIRKALNEGTTDSTADRDHLQDRYSIRCFPQYLGPIVEGIAKVSDIVTTEMNGVTDNPLIDTVDQRFYQSGNFLGQYIGIAMDDLRRYLGLLAKHIDVQIAQLVSPEFNLGLPASLSGNTRISYNMGLKGLQITGNSIMPLLTYYGNPLVEHYPTHAEQFNQNINGLSWGAANLAWQSVELFHQYAAVAIIFGIQSIDLRAHARLGHYDGRCLLGSLVEPLYTAAYDVLDAQPGMNSPLIGNDVDQSLERHLVELSANIRDQGSVIHSIRPLLDMFDQASLGC